MSFNIRPVTTEDAYNVAAVHVRSWKAAYQNIIPDDYLSRLDIRKRAEQFAEDLVKYKGKTHYYAAEIDSEIIGNMAFGQCRDEDRPQSGEVIGIYLLSEYWDAGYGKRFMDFGVNKLWEMGYREICLWVLEKNQRAVKFYKRYGFSPDGKKKDINIGKPLVEARYILNLH